MLDFLEMFCFLSTKIGADPFQIQGAGGNVSFKSGGKMRIKASGMHLKDAMAQDIFVDVDLKTGHYSGKNRPSIETCVHACLEKKFVFHTHDLYAMSYAVLENGEELLKEKLAHLTWRFVPYFTPGEDLAEAIRERGWTNEEILILKNHGLIVAAQTLERVTEILAAVRSALKKEMRPYPKVSLSLVEGYRLPADPQSHFLAFSAHDPTAILYPDQAIFLKEQWFWIEPRKGVAVSDKAPPSLDTALAMHGRLLSLLDDGARLSILPQGEVEKLRNWEAEKYRETLQRTH